ncbi:hypothetical protein Ddye_021899 [Dipteronia dyeriana]|uniref:Uncharacterized protein n=1 Tax=Dipteronia dyeriana TaxID=168575 RepID=A0AAD9U2K0_9ROSI|nr:hypothetical protein Ddye_021899 [Dipteronia dyeriana]
MSPRHETATLKVQFEARKNHHSIERKKKKKKKYIYIYIYTLTVYTNIEKQKQRDRDGWLVFSYKYYEIITGSASTRERPTKTKPNQSKQTEPALSESKASDLN